jgi:hypothetical protein
MTQVIPQITSLVPEQRDKLQSFLTVAFEKEDLRRFATERLAFGDVRIADEVDFNEKPSQVAYSLIEEALRYGHLAELVLAVRDARPSREDANALLVAFGLLVDDAAPLDSVIIPTVVREAVAAFSSGFQKNYQLFKYLEAYKQLHNVLHELKGSNITIATKVAERKADPSRALSDEVATLLDDLVKKAVKYVKNIEFPDKPPVWISRLVTAVNVIKGTDLEKMTSAVGRLQELPLVSLGPLNDKLLEFAKRLKPEELIRSLDKILVALGNDRNSATASLRSEVEEFRTHCSELDELIKAHNLCQKIDDALHEAAGRPSVSSEDLLYWGEAKDSLEELASQRKTDFRVQRTYKAAKLFEAANQGQECRTLIETFDDLFQNTDWALLEVIHSLPIKAMALRAALEVFQ